MSTGTLTGVRRTTVQTGTSTSVTPDDSERLFPKTPVRPGMLVDGFGDPFLFRLYGSYIAGEAFARAVGSSKTVVLNRDDILVELIEKVKTIWDTPNLQALLKAPLGSSIELTREEAAEIVCLAFGRRPDLPPGKEFVEEVRELLGHSLIERLKDIEQE